MLTQFRQFMSLQPRDILRGILGLMVISIGGSLLEAAGLALVFPLIGIVSDPNLISETAVLAWVYNFFNFTDVRSFTMFLGISMAAMFVFKNFYMAFFYFVLVGFVSRRRAQLAHRLIDMYLHAPYVLHLRRNSAEAIRNIVDLVGGIYGTFITSIITLVADVLIVTGIVVILLLANPLVTLSAGMLLGVLFILQHKFFGRLFQRLGTALVALRKDQQASLHRSLGAIKDAKVTCREDYFVEAHADVEWRVAGNTRITEFINRLPSMVTELVLVISMIGAILTLLMVTEDLTEIIATLGLLAAAAFRLVPMFNRILTGLNTLAHTREGIRVLSSEVQELIRAGRETDIAGARIPFRQSLDLKNLNFTYQGSDIPALHDVSLSIRQGDFIGLVGQSGAGKSTLADILLGLLEASNGSFSVDGKEITSANIRAWRANVGYMPQHIYISDDTLRRNVAFGIADSEIDDEKVWEALNQAHMAEFVHNMPLALDTPMGEHGTRLSGGQRQRVGIARALYGNPDVLIFDEATSALDVQTEHDITSAIQSLKGKRTLIIIAHRLATLQACDQLALMRDGRIVGTGSFTDLSAKDAGFKKMVDLARIEDQDRDNASSTPLLAEI